MNKFIFTLLLAIFLFTNSLYSQKYFTRDGKISFLSEAPMENIKAINSKATSVLDIESGNIEFAVLIKAFQFKKALMQEHFNENYLESSEFPKAIFKGKIDNVSEVDFSKDGSYEATVIGKMTIHGVTNPISTTGTINVTGGEISVQSQFVALVADYDIKIPGVVRDNIAKEVEITVDISYELLNINNEAPPKSGKLH